MMRRRPRSRALTYSLGQRAAAGAESQRALDSARANTARPGYSTFPKRVIPPVPPGSYDPALDAQERSTDRGLGDFRADYRRDFGETGGGGRMFDDFTLGAEDITRRVARGREDLDTQRGDIRTSFTRLGRRQGEQGRAHGILSAGIAAMSAAKRNENQGTELGRVDVAEQRLVDDGDRETARLGLGYQRAGEDASTGLERAEREGTQFHVDTDASRRYQAQVNGMLPVMPRRRRRKRK